MESHTKRLLTRLERLEQRQQETRREPVEIRIVGVDPDGTEDGPHLIMHVPPQPGDWELVDAD